ncbi:MAG: hypothetical protein A2Z91_03050 [Deltaproteobacteria bacterium GWA2_38_16]|nr:MAG: hypothetical protein A2Z91_03050 [Deltaproteobacteria bacterium GWA2_38_16]OGQ02924.1 MAG: hypothetical protein A3D19_06475 [Deltaproteobacteria bacterium RIFCSPHIGHO2_02_FULL_38_15]OGQ35141.1 MAG: hypothetical protein A3A72_03710 [Deltaproteobacteria bacterium RIFCSPLOWO2_01_FULL_38_9]OGQ61690.1 MAG: hypothetical protein A3G92_05750 [Deltaproteobacteria bacterium RIFCSPLOWO2_12_FULL_38_8]
MGALASFAYLYHKGNLTPLIAKSPIWTENAPLITSPTSNGSTNVEIFVNIAEKLRPTVVNIHTTQTIKGGGISPFQGFEDDEFFRRFFDDFFGQRGMPKSKPKDFKQQNLGSGFIISRDGYIITNNHVIEKADEIKVKLTEESKESYTAKLIGTDARTDIALIKIDPKGKELPVAPLGDSDKLRVGEWVAAIGHPFGYGHTVSHGIVSAKERLFGDGVTHPYNDYIQTDASINLGNSGGPLINIQGEVIGINVATDARAQGIIGFAIPINVAKNIIPQLSEKGHAIRGFIGIQFHELTSDLAKQFKLKKDQEGVVVAEIIKGEPADLAGLKVYDVIIEFNGKKVKSGRDLLQEVGKAPVGKPASLKILREGEEKILTLTPVERKDELERKTKKEKSKKGEEKEEKIKLGIQVDDLKNYPGILEKLEVGIMGVVITDIEEESPAGRASLEKGDIITEIDKQKVTSVSQFMDIVSTLKKKHSYLFRVIQQGAIKLVVIKVE